MTQEAIKALVSAQSAMTAAHKGKVNPAFRNKYATLSDVMDACLPALRENGFAVVQPIGQDDRGPFVETHILHESGHTFSTRVYLIIGKQDMQGFGSAVTYARRYGLGALAGITDTDDDGNAAAKSKLKPTVEAQREAFRGSLKPPHNPETGEIPRSLYEQRMGLEAGEALPLTVFQAATQGLRDAWLDGIHDSLPDQAPPAMFYAAVADALIAAFAAKKSQKGVSAQWDKRDGLIMEMQELAPKEYHRTLEAFNDRMAALREPTADEYMRAG
jgi:hypothetical protein